MKIGESSPNCYVDYTMERAELFDFFLTMAARERFVNSQKGTCFNLW